MKSIATLGLALTAVLSHADVIWDTGAPHPVTFNGTQTNLGLSSGNLGSTAPQRWLAIPFRISGGGAVINQVDVDYFVVAGSEAATVDYIIWSRTNLDAPTTMVTQGTLGAFGVGIDDPRVAGTENWLHQYGGLNINLAAGDYYFTVYGAGLGAGNTTGQSNVPWLIGADLQAEDLERDGAWRSASFPSPGFVNYAPSNILPGTGMADPEDRWNASFTMYGQPVPEPATMLIVTAGLALVVRRKR